MNPVVLSKIFIYASILLIGFIIEVIFDFIIKKAE